MAYTIKDIARESGYAVSTVSRAMNNHPDVSEEAKRKIGEIVAAHGFVPNSNAHQLKSQQTKSILVIVKGTFNPFFATIIEKMQALIASAGYTADVHYLEEESNEVQTAKQLAIETKPLGIVFLGGNAYTFQDSFVGTSGITLPSVLVTTVADNLNFPNLACVGVDDTEAFCLSVEEMIKKGHRKFAVLGGNLNTSYVSKLRFDGARKAFDENGIDFSDNMYQKANFTMGSGYRATKRLLEKLHFSKAAPAFTCLMCMSDVMAIGAMRALHESEIQVPEDVSVVGFDGIEQTAYTIPKLTTVVQPQSEIADAGIKKLLAMISKKSYESYSPLGGEGENVLLNPSLTQGESVREL